MTIRVETEMVEGGLEITRLVSNDIKIVIPAQINGRPVVSLGPMFLRDSHGPGSRTLIIPASVIRASDEALVSTVIKTISYLGDFPTFNSFKWTLSNDCQVICGDGFTFDFLSGYPMSFPEFDNVILSSHQRIYESTVMARLKDPYMLTDENREKYVHYMRSRTVPMAEHAILENDTATLKSVIETKLLSDDDFRTLLESSVRSGRTSSTSMIMTTLNAKSRGE